MTATDLFLVKRQYRDRGPTLGEPGSVTIRDVYQALVYQALSYLL